MPTSTLDPLLPTSLEPSCEVIDPPSKVLFSQKIITALIVAAPLAALGLLIPPLWDRAINMTDVVIAVIMYLVSGLGMTVGFHRLFTHRSFKATRALKIVLAATGSLAVEGSVTGWVAAHRRHHIFSDRAGDPHSPHCRGDDGWNLVRGLAYSHIGWLFCSDLSSAERYAPDLLRDRDIDRVGKLFPLFAFLSLAIPFGIGYALSGTLIGATTALIWGGLVRMALLHHVTWSINSICHTFGRRTEITDDKSTNFWPLAVLSFGESWHNIHHAHPAWARHGARRGMVDPSARVIKMLESAGWATSVRWPSNTPTVETS